MGVYHGSHVESREQPPEVGSLSPTQITNPGSRHPDHWATLPVLKDFF